MINDFLLNILLISGFVFATAQLANFVCEASERSRKNRKEFLKKLHIKALTGDHKSSEEWEEAVSEM